MTRQNADLSNILLSPSRSKAVMRAWTDSSAHLPLSNARLQQGQATAQPFNERHGL